MTETSLDSRRPRGCTPKRMRSPEEVEVLARRFAVDWRAGDQVMTWLRRHEGKTQELSSLVHDGWSWADVGRAMAVAGIHYRTGEPLSAATLCKKASEARTAFRKRHAVDAGDRAAIQTATEPPNAAADSPLPARAHAGRRAQANLVPALVPDDNLEPEFRPGWLRKHEPVSSPEPVDESGAEIIAPASGVPAAAGEDEEPEFRPAYLKGWSGTKIIRQDDKPPETKTPPAQHSTGDADEVIARLLGKAPPVRPAAAPEANGDQGQVAPKPDPAALPLARAAELMLANKRALEKARAVLRKEPRPPETAEGWKARIDQMLSQYGPEAYRKRGRKQS